MDDQLKAKWIEALRSGEFEQGSNYLEYYGKHCCLGVLCQIQDPEWKELFRKEGDYDLYTETLPPKLGAGLTTDVCESLATMNDNGSSFPEIADYIEENL